MGWGGGEGKTREGGGEPERKGKRRERGGRGEGEGRERVGTPPKLKPTHSHFFSKSRDINNRFRTGPISHAQAAWG